MIIDTSAIVAILWSEAEAMRFATCIVDADRVSLSAASYLELGIVIDGKQDPVVSDQVDGLLKQLAIDVAPFTASQGRIARQAYRDFGKGSGHKAQLNFGDCFAYALAAERGEPLLFKGDDFAHAGFARLA